MTSFRATFGMLQLGLGGGRKKGKKQAEEAARTNRRRTKNENGS